VHYIFLDIHTPHQVQQDLGCTPLIYQLFNRKHRWPVKGIGKRADSMRSCIVAAFGSCRLCILGSQLAHSKMVCSSLCVVDEPGSVVSWPVMSGKAELTLSQYLLQHSSYHAYGPSLLVKHPYLFGAWQRKG
jgi:hypothetical protein